MPKNLGVDFCAMENIEEEENKLNFNMSVSKDAIRIHAWRLYHQCNYEALYKSWNIITKIELYE